MINIILVDDHELFRLGVKTAIASRHPDICIVGEADTGSRFFNLLETAVADIVLLDIGLPDMNGIDIARRLKTIRPEMKILAISAENSGDVVQAMVEIGIEGFISKRHGGIDTLVKAIRSVAEGFDYFGKDISDIIYRIFVAKSKNAATPAEFTEQELRIIELCREGLPGKLIADQLNISTRTVENHKNNIFRKLGIHSTYEMVEYAKKKGIIRIEN
jgi:DNA-binding NarL/FixJ family response regulator